MSSSAGRSGSMDERETAATRLALDRAWVLRERSGEKTVGEQDVRSIPSDCGKEAR